MSMNNMFCLIDSIYLILTALAGYNLFFHFEREYECKKVWGERG